MTLESDTELLADRLNAQEFVEVVAHHSADGVAAGVILATPSGAPGYGSGSGAGDLLPSDLPEEGALVLCGMGASRTDLPEHVMVVDHHVPHFAGPYQLNPTGRMDGEGSLLSGAAYLLAQHLGTTGTWQGSRRRGWWGKANPSRG